MGRARWLGAALALALVAMGIVTASGPAAASASVTAAPSAGAPLQATIGNLGYGISRPQQIATGPDGNLWFVNLSLDDQTTWITRSSPRGELTVFPPSSLRLGGGIAAGPDGNLWVTGAGGIGRVSPTGAMTVFADPTIGTPVDITAGPDGALWFVDPQKEAVGRVTTTGSFSTFSMPGSHPDSIIAGPDGNLWFNRFGPQALARLAPTGAVTGVPVPTGLIYVIALAVGADGNVWYTTESSIGKVTMAGVATTVSTSVGWPDRVAAGPDGTMWFSNSLGNEALGRVSPDGVVNWVPSARATIGNESLNDLILGPAGTVWFTSSQNTIGSITADLAFTVHRGSWVSGPDDIAAAPSGQLVFSNSKGHSIGTVDPAGDISHLVDPAVPPSSSAPTRRPTHTVVATDGTIWFSAAGWLSKIATDGTVTNLASSAGRDLAPGPDGVIWIPYYDDPIPFPEVPPPGPGFINRVNGSGSLPTLRGPAIDTVSQITVLPDGTAWFVRKGSDLGWVKPNGDQGWFTPAGVTKIDRLTGGPDGNIWFTSAEASTIGRMTPQGVTTLFSTGALTPRAIASGPDGNLWFTSWPNDAIGRITPQGDVVVLTDPTIDTPTSIAAGPAGDLWFTNQGNNSIGQVALVPDAPTAVTATPGTTVARVRWVAPARTGGAAITSYTVTASPGGATCTSSGTLSCVVPGLSAGIPYTFVVSATNAVATGPPSAPSAATSVGRGGGYHPVTPTRILDSRTATGSWSAPLAAGAPRALQVSGTDGAAIVPDGAAAVVMNVTATGGTANSFVTAWPAGGPQPGVSNLNFGVGQTIPNLVTVKLGTGGKVAFANAAGAVDLIADVVGYYDDGTIEGDRFTGVAPVRLLDSRTEVGGWDRQLVAGTSRDLLVRQPTNPGGVPPTATAVVVNLTATEGTAGSFLSARPSGTPASGTSNVNFDAGQTIPNLAIVKVGADGAITLTNAVGAVDVIVDLVGYFDPTAGSRFHAVDPTRVLDDRVGVGLSGPWGPGQTRSLTVGGASGSPVPGDATGLIANVTATGATAGSFVTVFPTGGSRPNSSNLNFGAGQTIPNLVMVGVGPDGSVDLSNAHGSVDLVADAVGYFAAT